MTLSSFIHHNIEQIIGEWEAFVATLVPGAKTASHLALYRHSRQILRTIAKNIETAGGEHQATAADLCEDDETAAASLGALHHGAGFDLLQLSDEFRALRTTVVRLWMAQGIEVNEASMQELMRFNDAVDQALAEAIARCAEEVERSRSIFLSILGHDLRTPLGAIAMTTQYLQLPGVTPQKQLEALARIDRSVAAMTSMIKDLLEFTKTRLAKGIPIQPAPTDLGELCRAALDEARTAHPDREFQLETDGDLQHAVDTVRLKQVLWNLLNNAVQHGAREFPITLQARGEADRILLQVVNRGPVIPDDVLQVIFNPLVQGRDATGPRSAPAANLGLGLFIAREIVHAHHGWISAHSSEERTVFDITLPRVSDAR